MGCLGIVYVWISPIFEGKLSLSLEKRINDFKFVILLGIPMCDF